MVVDSWRRGDGVGSGGIRVGMEEREIVIIFRFVDVSI